MKTKVAALISLLIAGNAFASGIESGTYKGLAVTGAYEDVPCTVTVENNGPFAKKITIVSGRLEHPLVWKRFWNNGSDYQRNEWISGYVQLHKDRDGVLYGISMQYETDPTPFFNLSTVSEMCVDLRK